MIRTTVIAALAALGISATPAGAAGGDGHVEDVAFSFEGVFGSYDANQLQRGLKVYTEVCASCHGLEHVPLRTLADVGGPHFTKAEVRAYAEQNFEIFDAELDDLRPARPTDHFPESVDPSAPDLSLMAKARAGFHGPYGTGLNQLFRGMGGPEYIASIITGYTGGQKTEAGATLYENTAYPGGWISMAPPLEDGLVEFDDGHANDLHHMAEDVAAFLMWTAEPKMMARKQAGFVGVLFLILLALLLFLSNKTLWAAVKGRKRDA